MAGLEFAVLGDPVDHSLSPALHQAALAAAGIEGRYRAIRADRRRLEQTIAEMRDGQFAGLNVTMPLKRDAYQMTEDLTAEAATVGSVNAVRVVSGRVQGHSTDAMVLERLIDEMTATAETPVLVLGAGAAATAAVMITPEHPVYISARRIPQATDLAEKADNTEVVPWGSPVMGALVINATPIGMAGESLQEGLIEMASGLIDLPYGIEPTPTVQLAAELKIPIVDGITFLVAQAIESFRWWTGIEPSAEAMLQAARKD